MSGSPRQILKSIAVGLFALALAFLPQIISGVWAWPAAWVYSILLLLNISVPRLIIARKWPDLMKERLDAFSKQDAQPGDRLLVSWVAFFGPFVLLVVIGLNVRFAWPPPIPAGWILPSLLLVIFGFTFSSWAMVANRYFSAVVRLQKERGQTVVSSGPYHFVRHPGYAGAALAYCFTPWAMSAFWAVVPAALLILALFIRTRHEDRLLQRELPGYPDYAKKTRFRWLPGIW